MSPGLLSRWLGYVPVGEEMAAVTVEEAVEADPALTDFARRAVLAVYREVRRS